MGVETRLPMGEASLSPRWSGRFKPAEQIACYECGAKFHREPGILKDHLVAAHGYVREGAMVFKRQPCHCGKPGLYRVGAAVFCKAHRAEAVHEKTRYAARIDARRGAEAVLVEDSLKRRKRIDELVAWHTSRQKDKRKK